MNNENKYLQLLGKKLTKEATLEEEQQLEEWAGEAADNRKLVEEIELIWKEAVEEELTVSSDKEAAWVRLEQQLNVKATNTKTSFKQMLWYKLAVAAVFVLAVGITYLYQQESISVGEQVVSSLVEVKTDRNERKQLRLPDGSKIVLNEQSSLRYDNTFQPRVIQLDGEAFFEVVHQQGKAFEVLTPTTKITVLGTSFNVRAYDNTMELAVVTGKVAVEVLDAPNEQMILLPQQMAVYQQEKGLEKKLWQDANILAWKTQELVFENQNLSTVLSTLERHYQVKIEGSAGLLNCHYTGNFSQTKLEDILKTIAFTFPTGVEIKKKNGKFILIGQGCN